MTFRKQLLSAFERRRAANRRYSLRSFARVLRTDHSSLSKVLGGKRRLTAKTIRSLGSRLHLPRAEIEEYCVLEHEAAILRALDDARFQANSRWLAMVLNIPIDDINIALQRLLRKGELVMISRNRWLKV